MPSSIVRLSGDSALAPSPYACSATTDGASRPIFVAGACPLDRQGEVRFPGDVEAQAGLCLDDLRTAVAEAGATLGDLIYTRVIVATADQSELVRAWDVVHATFAEHEVPSTLSGVTVLGYPGQLVEIEAVAAVPLA